MRPFFAGVAIVAAPAGLALENPGVFFSAVVLFACSVLS